MQTELSLEDVYDILEVASIDAHNRNLALEYQKQQAEQL